MKIYLAKMRKVVVMVEVGEAGVMRSKARGWAIERGGLTDLWAARELRAPNWSYPNPVSQLSGFRVGLGCFDMDAGTRTLT